MKKLFLLAAMLVATQFAWAAEPMFFCGQTYYESQEIKSEYIKSGTVYLDIENHTFTVTNAVIDCDADRDVFTGPSEHLVNHPLDESFTIKFVGNNTIKAKRRFVRSYGGVTITGNSLADNVTFNGESFIFEAAKAIFVKDITLTATTSREEGTTPNYVNNRNRNILSTENCSLSLTSARLVTTYMSGITCNGTYLQTPDVMNFNSTGNLMNGSTYARNLEIRPITNANQPIQFENQVTKSQCVNNWDTNGDGELSYAEAAAVTSLGNVFKNSQYVLDFYELQYFTGLTEIGESAFEGSSIRRVTIPANVTNIARSAFRNTTKLITVLIPYPSKLRTIGMFAFEGSSIKTLGAPLEVVTIDSYAFKNCTQLKEITLGSDKLKTIGSEAFMGCTNLGSGIFINFPRTLSTVGARTFKDCSNLNIDFNFGYVDQGVSIGAEAFSGSKVGPIYINTQSTLNLKLDDNALTGSRGDLKCYLSNCTYPIVRDHAATAWTAQNAAKLEVFAQKSDNSYFCPFYLDEDVKFESTNVRAYIVTKYVQEGDRLNLYYVKLEDGIIPANTPVMFSTSISGGRIDIERLPAGSAQPVKVKNFLTGTLKETYLSSVSGKTLYKYVESREHEFAPLSSNYRANRVNPGTCYLEIPEVIPGTVTYAKMISTDPTGGQPLAGNGDVNGDGVVDITDVNILINILLGKDSANKYTGADVNGDGTVDIADINAVLNLILGK